MASTVDFPIVNPNNPVLSSPPVEIDDTTTPGTPDVDIPIITNPKNPILQPLNKYKFDSSYYLYALAIYRWPTDKEVQNYVE